MVAKINTTRFVFISVALGFDRYVVIRHGVSPKLHNQGIISNSVLANNI